MNISIRLDGFEKLQVDLGKIVNKEKVSNALEQSAILVEGEAKLRCPVATGRLQKSIMHHKISDLTQEVRASADYADYVEYGTFKMEAGTPEDPYVYMGPVSGKFPSYRPFLRSALYDKTDQIIKLIEKSLSENNV